MNERLAQVGNQVKQAFSKVGDAWKNQEPARRKRIIILAVGLVVLALGLIIVLNVVNSRYAVLYEGMSRDESTQALGVLETQSIPARVNSDGELEVPSKFINAAMAQLALQGIPSTTLDYNIIAQASGLTTTESEKQEYARFQWQNRLQDTIKTMTGVQTAIVNLNLPKSNRVVWDTTATPASGSVLVTMMPGYVLSGDQAYGIRYLVGSSVGIDPTEVTVMDQNGNMLAAAGQDYDMQAAVTSTFLERQDLEKEVERRMVEKAKTLLSMQYPNLDDLRIVATAELDFDAMVTESKEYIPWGDTGRGVTDEEELDLVTAPGQLAEGVVGETDNDDVPIYVDWDGDGVYDTVDYHRYRDYAVSYVLEQIEKDGPTVANATLSVVVNDTLTNETRQSLREALALATGLPLESVGVQGMLIATTPDPTPDPGDTVLGIPILFVYIAAAAVVALILVLVLVMILRGRAKKKRLALEQAELEAEQAEAERIQAEIEERKRQLKDAAIGDQSENAITNEVREFARNNPEITATLLRNWLKEGD